MRRVHSSTESTKEISIHKRNFSMQHAIWIHFISCSCSLDAIQLLSQTPAIFAFLQFRCCRFDLRQHLSQDFTRKFQQSLCHIAPKLILNKGNQCLWSANELLHHHCNSSRPALPRRLHSDSLHCASNQGKWQRRPYDAGARCRPATPLQSHDGRMCAAQDRMRMTKALLRAHPFVQWVTRSGGGQGG